VVEVRGQGLEGRREAPGLVVREPAAAGVGVRAEVVRGAFAWAGKERFNVAST
jgi:hypothetical protein